MNGFEELMAALKESNRPYDFDMITQAYEYADKAHERQMRQSGEPYITHPIAVARILVELGMDTETICAGLLHDVVEDTDATLEGIRKQLELHGVTDGLEVLVADRQAEADSQDDGLPYEYSVGRQLTAELIRRESMATALIGVNDMTALGILSELAAQGLRVPRDFSVCGFDNIFSSSITTPGLTTIDHHLRTRCQAAVDMVITQSTPSRIPTPFVNKIEYTPQLIVRSSTGQSPTHRSSEKI